MRMGLFGRKKAPAPPPHPRREPRIDLPLNERSLGRVFEGCVDFKTRVLYVAGDAQRQVTLCYVAGMVRLERACDYVLRPLSRSAALRDAPDMGAVYEQMLHGGICDLTVKRVTAVDEAVFALIDGDTLLLFPDGRALSFSTGTEEKRSVSDPEDEPAVKGAKDSFVESLRTNTSLVRRRLRAPELRVEERIVGRQSVTPVDLLYLNGIANEDTVAAVRRRLDGIDISALLMPGDLEEYINDTAATAFPLITYTQRPDRFCEGLAAGYVGVIADGIPQGYLLPATLGGQMRTGQERSQHWMVASSVLLLRYACLLLSLLLPALYLAAVTFHPEIIPTKLALSIAAAKTDVPFSAVFEVIVMLLAFEVLQEAGQRLPASIGQSVSIIGGLVVGSAAVDAKIVSPAVLIVVAAAGIAGYTMPSQDLLGALRLWRLVLAVLAALLGLWGVTLGALMLICHLAELRRYGVAYLTPFAAKAGEQVEGHTVIRQPLPRVKLRELFLKTNNRRNQK